MEKMELSEALKANASVLEGLIPLATNEANGLMSAYYSQVVTRLESGYKAGSIYL